MHERKVLRWILSLLDRRFFFLYWALYRAYKNYTDRHERAWVSRFIAPGDVIVDIGANVGVYSTYFAKLVQNSGRVFAFEPDPQNFARLQKTTRGLSQVVATQSAVGEITGSTQLFRAEGLNFDHRTFSAPDDDSSVQVPIIRLDDFEGLRNHRFRLLKIDVQGSELGVLRGARDSLASNPEAKILLEYAPWGLISSGSSPDEFIALLRDSDFVVTAFDNEPDLLFEGKQQVHERDWYRNLVLSHQFDEFVSDMTRVSLEPSTSTG